MSEIVIDSGTQFIIGIAVEILAIVVGTIVAVAIFLKSRSRKLVTYKVLTQENLLSISNELKNNVKIFYDSMQVENVTLFKIEIANSGTKEIKEKDYVEPISIFFGEESQILSIEITESKPHPFPMSLAVTVKVISLSKSVFNAGESITLKILVSNPSFRVSGRIAGGKIQQIIPKNQSPNFPWYILFGATLVGLVGMIFSALFDLTTLGGLFVIILFFPIIILFTVAIYQVYTFAYSKLHK
jgi:hypothetical protein